MWSISIHTNWCTSRWKLEMIQNKSNSITCYTNNALNNNNNKIPTFVKGCWLLFVFILWWNIFPSDKQQRRKQALMVKVGNRSVHKDYTVNQHCDNRFDRLKPMYPRWPNRTTRARSQPGNSYQSLTVSSCYLILLKGEYQQRCGCHVTVSIIQKKTQFN